MSLKRDVYHSLFSSLPARFKYATLAGYPDLLPEGVTRLKYQALNQRDEKFITFLHDFLYRDEIDDLRIVGVVGSVGVGKTHLMCGAANLPRCHDYRTVVDWRSITYDLLKSLDASPKEYVDLLLEWGYLFIDDVKLENKLQTEIFTLLITTLYNQDKHPGMVFTENWDPAQGDIKAVWNSLVPTFVYDRLVNMTAFMPMVAGSRRSEQ